MSTYRKHRRNAPPGFFGAEAAGLRWLAEPDAVRIVQVLRVGDDFIELERLTPVAPTVAAAAQFGRDLARLHDAGAPAFGSPPDGWQGPGWIGDAPLSFSSDPTWGRWFATHRVRPYLASLSHADRDPVERVCALLDAGVFDDDAPPARIHGDLWAGNLVFTEGGCSPDGLDTRARSSPATRPAATDGLDTRARSSPATRPADAARPADGLDTPARSSPATRPTGTDGLDTPARPSPATRPTLIDPAAHGGHRITDLAMLALFGAPHLPSILTAYAATSSHLPEGWQELIPLHQLHPLLVHAELFGGSYGAQAADAAMRVLRSQGHV